MSEGVFLYLFCVLVGDCQESRSYLSESDIPRYIPIHACLTCTLGSVSHRYLFSYYWDFRDCKLYMEERE